MTVNTELSRIVHDGDGASQSFAVQFYFLQDSDLTVYVGGIKRTLTTDYTVSGAGNPGGGSVTFMVVPPAGLGNVVIIRDPDQLQSTKYPANDPFPARTHETALDKLTMLVQRTRDLIERAFTLPDSDASGAALTIPTPSPSTLIGWNPSGTALQNVNVNTLATTVAFGTARADLFDGNGVQTAFTLSANPGAQANLDVSVAGVTLRAGLDFSWNTGTTLTFTTAPPTGTKNILARYVQAIPATGGLQVANNLSDLGNVLVARNNLGLASGAVTTVGTAATRDAGTAAGNVVLLDGSAKLPGIDASQLVNLPVQPAVRQSVLGGATDANGYANWLSAGTGLTVNYTAAASPVRLAFASGYADLVTDLSANQASAFGTLPATNTSFLYADRSGPTAISGGNTLVPPQYGYTFDRSRAALLHFDGANGQTTATDDWGNTVTLTNATISTAQSKFGGSSLSLNGTTAFADLGITALGGGGLCMECFVRRGSAGTLQIIFEASNASSWGIRAQFNASNFLEVDLSSSGGSNDIGIITGTTAITVDGLWHHVAIVYDALAGKYFAYLDGVSQGTPLTSALRICAIGGTRIGAARSNGSGLFNGFVDEFRYSTFCPYPNGTTFTPATSPFAVNQGGQLACWFDIPNMVMREVSGPSSTAGANPAFTARTRVFVGEADTGTSSVAVVRNYAYQGIYVSSLTALQAAGTPLVFNHNLGVKPLLTDFSLLCTAPDASYAPGQWARATTSAAETMNPVGRITPLSLSTIGTGSTVFDVVSFSSGAAVGIATTKWMQQVVARRGWGGA